MSSNIENFKFIYNEADQALLDSWERIKADYVESYNEYSARRSVAGYVTRHVFATVGYTRIKQKIINIEATLIPISVDYNWDIESHDQNDDEVNVALAKYHALIKAESEKEGE